MEARVKEDLAARWARGRGVGVTTEQQSQKDWKRGCWGGGWGEGMA